MCGLNGIRDGKGTPLYFMEKPVVDALVKQCAAWLPDRRYSFALHGEPTLHPRFYEIAAQFREALPNAQIMLTTNGAKWQTLDKMRVGIARAIEVGIDIIMLDTYRPERQRLLVAAQGVKDLIRVVDFYNDRPQFHPHHNHGHTKEPVLLLMDDLQLVTGLNSTRVIVNHVGNSGLVPALQKPRKSKCTNVFRDIDITFNGNVLGCCMDFGQELICGNIMEETLEQIWTGSRFTALRSFLYNKLRVFTPCARCDFNGGPRQGLLPRCAMPTEEQHRIMEDIVFGGTKRNRLRSFVLWKCGRNNWK